VKVVIHDGVVGSAVVVLFLDDELWTFVSVNILEGYQGTGQQGAHELSPLRVNDGGAGSEGSVSRVKKREVMRLKTERRDDIEDVQLSLLRRADLEDWALEVPPGWKVLEASSPPLSLTVDDCPDLCLHRRGRRNPSADR
jgi:hypothetical protein